MKFLILFQWIIIAYIAGSIPIGYLIGKSKGVDLTKTGSGGTGATNVLRAIGKTEAIITLLLDVLKGFLPVYFCFKFTGCHFTAVFTAIFAILGHSKSIFLNFKGGKSSAIGLGVVIALSWKVAAISFAIWVTVVYVSKYSSLGSIIAVPLVPLWFYIFDGHIAKILFGVFATIYIVGIRHRENIKRLFNGTEPKITEKIADSEQSV